MDQLVQNLDRLSEYLTSGAGSPDSVVDCVTGYRLAHAAVKANRLDALLRILDAGADVQMRSVNGDFPLHVCARHGRISCLRLLLDRAVDPNPVNNARETPLHLAVAAGHVDIVKELLDRGAVSGKEDAYHDNALHVACFKENCETVRLISNADPSLIKSRNASGSTPLHIAAARENPELLTLLLKHGADFTVTDANGKTPVDILTENGDTSGIDSLGRQTIRHLRKFVNGEDILQIITSPEGTDYLSRLLQIDGLWKSATVTAPATEEDKRLQLVTLEATVAMRKVDADRLINELNTSFNTGMRLDLEAAGLLSVAAWKLVQLVLFPQNESLLQRLVANRSMWAALSRHIELSIDRLYAKVLRKKKAGVRELLRRHCTDSTGQVIDFGKLNKFLATLTGYWCFSKRKLMFDTDKNCVSNAHCSGHKRPMRDPLQTIVMWAILTGRLRLVPTLLRQEEFDLVPLALLATTILRSLSQRHDIEDVFVDKAGRVADICEGMAIQVMKQVKEVDNSPNNSLTISYVSLSLPNYAGYNILDLSARGGAREFIKLDIVELATDKDWYGDFFDFSRSLTRELVILSGFVPPLMLLLPRLIKRYRRPGARNFLEYVLNDPKAPDNADNGEKDTADEKPQEYVKLLSIKKRNNPGGEISTGGQITRRSLPHRTVEYVKEMLHFYKTPCVKFRLHAFFYFMFIGLLSYMVLHDFQGNASTTEIFCYFALLGIFVEELNEMISAKKEETLSVYLSDGWNVIDLVAITCGVFAFIARQLSPATATAIYGSRQGKASQDLSYIFIVITTLILWIRILFISIVLESVGVKLKMLSLMIKKDFIPFLYILIVIMLGFGIAFHALLWPNGRYINRGKTVSLSGSEILIEMFHRTFYTIVGEYGLDDLSKMCKTNFTEGDDAAEESEKCVDSPGNILVPYVLMVAYIVIVQVLLLNVIVAMFSKTIDRVDSESKSLWLFERYDLNLEFIKRSALPAPLNIALEARNLIVWLLVKLRCSSGQRRQSRMETLAQNQNNFVYLFYLFYQAVTLRRLRQKLDGIGLEEDDLSQEGAAFHKKLDEVKKQQQAVVSWLDEQSEELRQQRVLLEQLIADLSQKKTKQMVF